MRGVIGQVEKRVLCDIAQEEFDVFCTINVVSLGQLYGGKICAALDRQHPRDLFDVKLLLENEGFTQEIKTGFIYALLSSKRPLQELLFPHFADQSQTFVTQFEGMTLEPFTYQDFENTRIKMLEVIHSNLSTKDNDFIVSFEKTEPDWAIYDFEKYPSVQWKLQNLLHLKTHKPDKHLKGINFLQENL